MKRGSAELQPFQVSAAASRRCKAAVHAVRRLVDEHMSDDEVLVKLDFTNAFNTAGREFWNPPLTNARAVSLCRRFFSLQSQAGILHRNHHIQGRLAAMRSIKQLSYIVMSSKQLYRRQMYVPRWNIRYQSRGYYRQGGPAHRQGGPAHLLSPRRASTSTIAKEGQHIRESFPTGAIPKRTIKCEMICNNLDIIDQYPVLRNSPELSERTWHNWVFQFLKARPWIKDGIRRLLIWNGQSNASPCYRPMMCFTLSTPLPATDPWCALPSEERTYNIKIEIHFEKIAMLGFPLLSTLDSVLRCCLSKIVNLNLNTLDGHRQTYQFI